MAGGKVSFNRSCRPNPVQVYSHLAGQVEVLAEVLETFVGEGVEVPLPAELGVDVTARGERLARLDDLEVRNVKLGVLDLEVLGGNHHTLCKMQQQN